MLRAAVTVAAMGLFFSALMFLPAGRLDWTLAWVYNMGLMSMFVAINWTCLTLWNPDLIRRRMRLDKEPSNGTFGGVRYLLRLL